MAEASLPLFAAVIAIALLYDFANGLNDAANAIATVISTRVLPPFAAIGMSVALNFAGAMVGLEVARTVGKGIVAPEQITLVAVMAGALAGALWTIGATRFGIPISVSHSLVGGLLGAGIASGGLDAIGWHKLIPVLVAIAAAPLLGLVAGYLLRSAVSWSFRRFSNYRVQSIFGKLQILSAAFMSFSHGQNDAQNARGIMLLALVIYTGNDLYWGHPPWWIYVAPALVMGLGTAYGGWRVIRTLGVRITKLRPVDGFCAETAAASVIEFASATGIPVSTTHCITGGVIGTGATRRLSAVRWGITRHIFIAWIVTIPVCAATGWLLGKLFGLF